MVRTCIFLECSSPPRLSLPIPSLPSLINIASCQNNAGRPPQPMIPNQLGDIIVAIDGQEINTETDLFKILESRAPGDVIAITAQR